MGGMAPSATSGMNSYSQGPMSSNVAAGQHPQSYMGGHMANSQMQFRQQVMNCQENKLIS